MRGLREEAAEKEVKPVAASSRLPRDGGGSRTFPFTLFLAGSNYFKPQRYPLYRDTMAGSKVEAELEQMAKESGASAFVRMAPSNVVTAHWVRQRCQFGCKHYGERLTCPPYSPTPEDTRKVLDEFETAYLLKYDGFLGLATYPPESLTQAVKKVSLKICDAGVDLERHAFLSGYYKAFLYGAHRCYRCETCAVEEGNTKCKLPVKARPSMESAGIDVFATAQNAGLEMRVLTDKKVVAPDMFPTFMLLLLE